MGLSEHEVLFLLPKDSCLRLRFTMVQNISVPANVFNQLGYQILHTALHEIPVFSSPNKLQVELGVLPLPAVAGGVVVPSSSLESDILRFLKLPNILLGLFALLIRWDRFCEPCLSISPSPDADSTLCRPSPLPSALGEAGTLLSDPKLNPDRFGLASPLSLPISGTEVHKLVVGLKTFFL